MDNGKCEERRKRSRIRSLISYERRQRTKRRNKIRQRSKIKIRKAGEAVSRTKGKQRYRRAEQPKTTAEDKRMRGGGCVEPADGCRDKQTCDGSIRGGAFQICSCGVSLVI